MSTTVGRSSKPTPKREASKRSRERLADKVSASIGSTGQRPKDRRWWKSMEPHVEVFDDGERISRLTRASRQRDFYLACLYDDEELAALVGGLSFADYSPQTLSSNVIKRQVDAFTTKMTKNRPLPMPLTKGGSYSEQRRAKALGKFFEGTMDQVGYWPTRELRIRDGALFGAGLAYNYRVGGKLHHDRLFPWEVEVDPREAMYGKPLTFRIRRYIDRLELIERYPDFEEEILQADGKADDDRWEVGWDDTCDLVLTRGVWRVSPNECEGEGHFALCISNATLELDEYKRAYPPLSKFSVLPGLVGWRGQSIAKSLVPLQYEVNSIGMRLQEQGYMTGSYLLIEDGSGVETDTVDNGTLSIVRYRGTKPEFEQPPAWHPQFFEWYQFLRGRAAAEETRLSEMAVRGEKPPGLDSGAAVRAWKGLDDEAYIPAGRCDERDAIESCWQFFDLVEEIYAERGEEKDDRKAYTVSVEARAHGRTEAQDLSFDKVRIDRAKFMLRVFPTSFLRGTPEEQIQTVRELIDSGFLSQDEALALIDFPDLQRVMNLRGAARRNIERLLEKLKDAEGQEAIDAAYEYPEPAWNLELCKALALMAYLEAKLDGVEAANLKAIMKFATDAQAELDAAAAGTAAGAQQAHVDANAPADEPLPAPGVQYAPPDAPPLPVNAVAPEAMPMLPPQ